MTRAMAQEKINTITGFIKLPQQIAEQQKKLLKQVEEGESEMKAFLKEKLGQLQNDLRKIHSDSEEDKLSMQIKKLVKDN